MQHVLPPGILEEALQPWPHHGQAHSTAAANERLAFVLIPTLPRGLHAWLHRGRNWTCQFRRFPFQSAYVAESGHASTECESIVADELRGGGGRETRMFLVVFQRSVRSPSLLFVFGFCAERGTCNGVERPSQARKAWQKRNPMSCDASISLGN